MIVYFRQKMLHLVLNPSCFQKIVEAVLDRQSRALDIALTVNNLVKHPRSGLPPTVLYNLSYLHYITLQSYISRHTLF